MAASVNLSPAERRARAALAGSKSHGPAKAIDVLRQYSDDLGPDEIAAIEDVLRAARRGVRLRPRPEDLKDEVKARLAAGQRNAEIARDLSLSTAYVSQIKRGADRVGPLP